MKLKLKTIKGVVVDLEVDGADAVSKVKAAAAACELGAKEGWDASTMKLIHQGKVLTDVSSLATYGIKEEDFLVVMAPKAKTVEVPPRNT